MKDIDSSSRIGSITAVRNTSSRVQAVSGISNAKKMQQLEEKALDLEVKAYLENLPSPQGKSFAELVKYGVPSGKGQDETDDYILDISAEALK